MHKEKIEAVHQELRRLNEEDPVALPCFGDPETLAHLVIVASRVYIGVEESTGVLRDRLIRANQEIISLCQHRIEELQNVT